MKKCSTCNILKDYNCFNKNKRQADGYSYICKVCSKKQHAIYYQKNKERIRKKGLEYDRKNYKHRRETYVKQYQEKNKERLKNNYKKREHIYRERLKIYREKNREKLREKYRNLYHNDAIFKLIAISRARTYDAIIKNKNTKSVSTLDLLGAPIEVVKEHIEKQFKEGMTWSNHGEWHIDHIKPCSSFDLSQKDEQLKCFHYSNLQPLWKSENLSKGNKLFF